jgi:hypothetical protein
MALPANTKYAFSGTLDDAVTPFTGYWEIVEDIANSGDDGLAIYTYGAGPFTELEITVGEDTYTSVGEAGRIDEIYLLRDHTMLASVSRGAPESFNAVLTFTGGSGMDPVDPIPDDLSIFGFTGMDIALTKPVVLDGTITSWTVFSGDPPVVVVPEFPLGDIRGRHRYTKGKRSSMTVKPRGFYLNRRK